jgi:hypothetical protein
VNFTQVETVADVVVEAYESLTAARTVGSKLRFHRGLMSD